MCAGTLQVNAREQFPHDRKTMAEGEKNDQEEDKNALLAWEFREHFTYKPGQEGRNITVQCKLCLPSTKLRSASRDSTSNLKKHLEVSWIISVKGEMTLATINPAPPAESAHMRGKKGGLMSASSHVSCPTLTKCRTSKAYFKLCIFTFCINVKGSMAVVCTFRAEKATLF